MEAERCAACQRVFRPPSKPLWAFTLIGRAAGRIHTTCRNRFWLTDPAATLEAAQFRTWEWDIRKPRPDGHSDRWYAGMLAGWEDAGADETLTEAQEALIQHWIDGGTQLTPERAAAIRLLYADLVREFLTWRTALEGG